MNRLLLVTVLLCGCHPARVYLTAEEEAAIRARVASVEAPTAEDWERAAEEILGVDVRRASVVGERLEVVLEPAGHEASARAAQVLSEELGEDPSLSGLIAGGVRALLAVGAVLVTHRTLRGRGPPAPSRANPGGGPT